VIEARKMVIEMLEAFMMRYPWDVRLWIFVSEAMALKLKLLLEGEKPKGASEVKSSSADLPSRLQKSGSL